FVSSASLLSLAAFPRAGAPVLLQAPRDQSVLVGSSATFSVEAAGEGPLTYQWFFNGVELLFEMNPTLSLANVQLARDGVYQVVINNDFGTVTAEAALHVLAQVVITSQPI